jgi:hypothetical protein
MKKNILVVVLFAAVAVLAVVVVRQNQQIADMKGQLASAAAEKAKARKAPPVPALKRELAKALPQVKPAGTVTEAAPVTTPSPDAQASTSTATASNLFAGVADMMKNPGMKEIVRAQQKVMIGQMYGSLSKHLNLSADELDALNDLLLERQMAMVDAGLSAMSGSESDRKQAKEDAKAIKTEYDQKIKDLLSPQDYQAFKDYEKTVGERVQVQMFKSMLPADAALTDQQEYDLISAMYEERKAMPASSLVNNQNPDPSQLTADQIGELLKQLDVLQQAYAKRAAAILSPSQLEQFTKWQEQWSAMQAAGLKMAAQVFGKKSAPPPPAAK